VGYKQLANSLLTCTNRRLLRNVLADAGLTIEGLRRLI